MNRFLILVLLSAGCSQTYVEPDCEIVRATVDDAAPSQSNTTPDALQAALGSPLRFTTWYDHEAGTWSDAETTVSYDIVRAYDALGCADQPADPILVLEVSATLSRSDNEVVVDGISGIFQGRDSESALVSLDGGSLDSLSPSLELQYERIVEGPVDDFPVYVAVGVNDEGELCAAITAVELAQDGATSHSFRLWDACGFAL